MVADLTGVWNQAIYDTMNLYKPQKVVLSTHTMYNLMKSATEEQKAWIKNNTLMYDGKMLDEMLEEDEPALWEQL
jgi:hypothetical protein